MRRESLTIKPVFILHINSSTNRISSQIFLMLYLVLPSLLLRLVATENNLLRKCRTTLIFRSVAMKTTNCGLRSSNNRTAARMTSRKRSNDDDDDFVYGNKGFRVIFESMIPGSKLHISVIDLWATLLNLEEQRRNKNSTS
ncbi:hypothetical protein LXL04_010115 [Taraxacum kok-saghyz]